eukprot:jgi/Ulvmu1/10358/UM061_0041.1
MVQAVTRSSVARGTLSQQCCRAAGRPGCALQQPVLAWRSELPTWAPCVKARVWLADAEQHSVPSMVEPQRAKRGAAQRAKRGGTTAWTRHILVFKAGTSRLEDVKVDAAM